MFPNLSQVCFLLPNRQSDSKDPVWPKPVSKPVAGLPLRVVSHEEACFPEFEPSLTSGHGLRQIVT
jgi:hypothetical protein